MSTLSRKGIPQSADCARCNVGVEESELHCVRDCNLPRQMWQAFGMGSPLFFQHDDFSTWQQEAVAGNNASLFYVGLWQAWCARNVECLGGENVPLHKILREVQHLASIIELGIKAGDRTA